MNGKWPERYDNGPAQRAPPSNHYSDGRDSYPEEGEYHRPIGLENRLSEHYDGRHSPEVNMYPNRNSHFELASPSVPLNWEPSRTSPTGMPLDLSHDVSYRF